jgi:glutathione synthase
MRFLFVMDPPERLDRAGDSTLAFIDEAGRRGHETLSCQPGDLRVDGGRVLASAAGGEVSLDGCEAVFLRKDPPYDVAFHLHTLLCEPARERTVFINDPRGLRECHEKLFALRFPDLMPPTLVTSDMARLRAFLRAEGGEMILKPLEGAGGAGVLHVREADRNAGALIELLTDNGRRWAMAQRYVPEARAGDKRILLLDGKPLGAVLRVPRDNETRANLHVGGRAARAELGARDLEICGRVGPELAALGLVFVGLDVLGPWLTEINVTSPTGIRQIDALDGVRLEADVIDWVERRAAERAG